MATTLKSMQALWKDSYLCTGNEAYLEELFELYLKNPLLLTPEWKQFFDLWKQNHIEGSEILHTPIREAFSEFAQNKSQIRFQADHHLNSDSDSNQVAQWIDAYRRFGHLQANINPLQDQVDLASELSPLQYGISQSDLNNPIQSNIYPDLAPNATLAQLQSRLQKTYCASIGFEYMHITRSEEVTWIQNKIETEFSSFTLTDTQRQKALDGLIAADGLEKYLGFKYVGQKRFSLEGNDSLIPLLDHFIQNSLALNIQEVVIGMSHRGRLNVLVNIVGKSPQELFDAFDGKHISNEYSGDVKYHMGYSSDVLTPQGEVHVALAFNPSHLEIVAPVAQGSVRLRQRRRRDTDQQQVLPIHIHGDSAFAGQGVVMEMFSLSQTRWFKVGGSIHIVVNNQVGFTTSAVCDTRSTRYCTDVAKMVEAPILHVNANDVEAVIFAAKFALEYRQQFKRDVVIDLIGFRRHGHNEADEPFGTQPLMYQKIKTLEPTFQVYAKQLIARNQLKPNEEQERFQAYRAQLEKGEPVVKTTRKESQEKQDRKNSWQIFQNQSWRNPCITQIPLDQLKQFGKALTTLPADFVLQMQVKKNLDALIKMYAGEQALNWGAAENLAYASLLAEGFPIRLCGQDAGRGTFAHRHAVLHDQKTDQVFLPLSQISKKQAHINIVDSLLSEEAVLAFEYGYACTDPNYLVIWEAQFGDFVNGAQVVIDQFLSSGEQKWQRLCGLVMLLPHGYEGAGPEHTSARLERFLQLCAQDNMQVCMPSTPAQMFHLLRRQIHRQYRKPLIVMTPKSLLRNPAATSSLSELSEGSFLPVIPEVNTSFNIKTIQRVIVCSGKIYYELIEARNKREIQNIAIIRLEQLYPFPDQELKQAMSEYLSVKDWVFCQEEPHNQGAYLILRDHLISLLGKTAKLHYIGRPESASPAVGYHAEHVKEQNEIINAALTL